MGIGSTKYGSPLIPIIMLQERRLHIACEMDKEIWEIDELMTVIKREVEAREASECVKLNQPKHPVSP